jgi:hypothetical protein
MIVELEIICDTYATTKTGKQTVVKRNDKVKRLFDLNEIDVEEYVDNKTGKHVAKYSIAILNGTGYKINKPYEELKVLVQNKSIPIIGLMGYKRKR